MYFSYGYQSAMGIEHALEAYKIFTRLWEKDNKKYALNLSKCAGVLSIGASKDESVAYLEREVELLSTCRDGGDTEESAYASALKNRCNKWVENDGDFAVGTKARATMAEALEIAKGLSEKNPSAYDRLYAAMLAGYGNMIINGSKSEDATSYLEKACKIYNSIHYMPGRVLCQQLSAVQGRS